jgi:CHAD domain-containing protein
LIRNCKLKKRYQVKHKKSLKENFHHILPEIFNDFISFSNVVTSKPLRKDALHQMRITGKPLRYLMELGERSFSDDYKKCGEEIKNMIELMGEIHDCDVMLPQIICHLKEIRLFNRSIPLFKDKLSTRIMRDLIRELYQIRRSMYSEMSNKLNEWAQTKFKAKLVFSMKTHPFLSTANSPKEL